MNRLLALADRVEKLTGPDREVDCLIYAAVFIPEDRAGKIDIGVPYVGWHPVDGPYVSAVESPRYTASLDAAMTLVPKNHMWSVESTGYYARVECYPGAGESAALALTCAALRARAIEDAGYRIEKADPAMQSMQSPYASPDLANAPIADRKS